MKDKKIMILGILLVISMLLTLLGFILSKKNNIGAKEIQEPFYELLFSGSNPIIQDNKLYFAIRGADCLTQEICDRIPDDEDKLFNVYLFVSDIEMKKIKYLHTFYTQDVDIYSLYDDRVVTMSNDEIIMINTANNKVTKIMDMTNTFAQYILVKDPITNNNEFGIIVDDGDKAVLNIYDKDGRKIKEEKFNHSHNLDKIYIDNNNYYTIIEDSSNTYIYKNNKLMYTDNDLKIMGKTFFAYNNAFYSARYEDNKIIIEEYSDTKNIYEMTFNSETKPYINHIKNNYFIIDRVLYYYDSKTKEFISLNEKINDYSKTSSYKDYLLIQVEDYDYPNDKKILLVNTKDNSLKTIDNTKYHYVEGDNLYLFSNEAISKYNEG